MGNGDAGRDLRKIAGIVARGRLRLCAMRLISGSLYVETHTGRRVEQASGSRAARA
jgi:hypothetical protein